MEPRHDTVLHHRVVLACFASIIGAIIVWLAAGPAIGRLIHPAPINPNLVHDGTIQFGTGACYRQQHSPCLTGVAASFPQGRRIWYIAHLHESLLIPGYDVELVLTRRGAHGETVLLTQSLNSWISASVGPPSPYGYGTFAPTFEYILDARSLSRGRVTMTIWETGHVLGAQGSFQIA
jgi:hypothetical protein